MVVFPVAARFPRPARTKKPKEHVIFLTYSGYHAHGASVPQHATRRVLCPCSIDREAMQSRLKRVRRRSPGTSIQRLRAETIEMISEENEYRSVRLQSTTRAVSHKRGETPTRGHADSETPPLQFRQWQTESDISWPNCSPYMSWLW